MSVASATPSSAPPVPPPRPQQPSTSAPTSHARFLLSQVLTSLEHLHTSGCLDALTHREVISRLNRAVLKEDHPPLVSSSTDNSSEANSPEDALGKRNAWVRKTMSETDLLPNVVETALGLVGSPFLGDTQIDAIVKLVEMSQENIAQAVTSPRNQRVASSGAFAGLKGVGTGVGRGVAVAGEKIATKREESKVKREEKREEKRKQRELKDELKREREMIKQKHLASGRASSSVAEQSPESSDDEDEDEDSASEDKGPRPFTSSQSPSSLPAGSGPQATVAYAQVGKASSSATTTFIPWPGVIISSTLVASPAEVTVDAASAQPQVKQEDEDRLRTRKPPPLPSASQSTIAKPQPAANSAQPPPAPPPIHHARSTLSQTSRPLDEIGEPVVGGNSNSRTNAPQQSARPPTSDADDNDGGVIDVTDSKRKNWKSRLLG